MPEVGSQQSREPSPNPAGAAGQAVAPRGEAAFPGTERRLGIPRQSWVRLMIELVITVCLIASSGSCREERPGFSGDSLLSCMTQGQFLAARWLEEHPAWQMTRWRCQPSSARQAPI